MFFAFRGPDLSQPLVSVQVMHSGFRAQRGHPYQVSSIGRQPGGDVRAPMDALQQMSMVFPASGADLFEQYSQAQEQWLQGLAEQQQQRQPAAARAVLDAMPVVKIRQQDLEQEPLECVICLEKMKVGDDAMRMPCGHCFHNACLRTWLTDNSNQCPVCRYELPTENVEYEASRRASTVEHRPRLGLEDLRARTVQELRYLAQHLGVSIDGCLEKGDLVVALVNSGRVDIRPSRPAACAVADDGYTPVAELNVPTNLSACGPATGVPASVSQADIQEPNSSLQVATGANSQPMSQADLAFLSTRNVRELKYVAEHLGVSIAGCVEKRHLIDAIVASGCTDVAAMVVEGAPGRI